MSHKIEVDIDFVDKTLAEARKRCGDTYQLTVAIEELCELGAVLAKFPRYHVDPEAGKKALYDKVLDEYADACLVLEHVQHIFNLDLDDVQQRIMQKAHRLARWLEQDDPLSVSLTDREV